MFEVRKTTALTLIATVAFSLCAELRAEDRKIAVVNVATVFTRYKKVKDIEANLKSQFEPTQNALEAEERDIRAKAEKNRIASADDDKAARVVLEEKVNLELKKFDLQVKAKKLYNDIEESRKVQMKNVLDEIRVVIGVIGRKFNYDLVMRAPEFGDEFDPKKAGDAQRDDNVSAAELVRRFRENPVLYYATNVDITEQVVELLNRDYESRPKGK